MMSRTKCRSSLVSCLIWLVRMKRFPDCEIVTTDRKIVRKENQSKIVFENPQKMTVRILEVDDCAITEGLRCDYALTVETIETEFYVELKGSDVRHAFAQLEATIGQISDNPQQQPKFCFIVSTRCPLSGSDIQKMQKIMKEKYKAKLVIKNREHTHQFLVP
jgi:hypothetical protein